MEKAVAHPVVKKSGLEMYSDTNEDNFFVDSDV